MKRQRRRCCPVSNTARLALDGPPAAGREGTYASVRHRTKPTEAATIPGGFEMSLFTTKAPDFITEAVVGDGDFKTISLSDFKGKYVVLFFYPADFTFICPTEIQEFSRRHEEFKAQNTVILGCSTDSKHSHKAWNKNGLGGLNHPLLADFNKTVARDYEALLDNG